MSAARPVVLFSTGPLKETDNPYLHELVAGLGAHADIRFLDPWTALRLRADVVHVHWPHQLVRGATRLRTLVKLLTSTVLLLRVARGRVPVVLTVHNLASHETGSRAERLLARFLDRLVSVRVYLNEAEHNDTSRGVVVLHGSYRPWLERTASLDDGRAAYVGGAVLFGMLRPYKGIERVVEAATAAHVPVLVAGRPVEATYAAELRALADRSPGVELAARHVPDDELVRMIRARDLVVLPYEGMYNSGALLYALAVGRPVLVPRSPANLALQAEVGPAWVALHDPPLTAEVLRDALVAARDAARAGPPPLDRRGWGTGVDLHRRVYATVEASPWRRRLRDPDGDQRANRRRLAADPAFGLHSSRNAGPEG
ncbi:hypothetical protein QWY28_16540 [Nocardioides sp. SOB77]|uniref:Glycosyltransferase n=1 Tax=Nocardioides oceani TaxID=3058369 RepID=A0ABT8FIR1_9ACTN|nr:glycosyltransferase [Nocardioides oceani]MDN4174571.1 hypothetical protein [Nocardioides oceani]